MQQDFEPKNAEGLDDASGAAAAVGLQSFDELLERYFAVCKERIRKNWHSASKVGYFRIEVLFRLHKDGSVTNPKITLSSGSVLEEQIALQTIRHTAPFPPLPPGATEYFDITFVFELSPVRQLEEPQAATRVGPPRRKVSTFTPSIALPGQYKTAIGISR